MGSHDRVQWHHEAPGGRNELNLSSFLLQLILPLSSRILRLRCHASSSSLRPTSTNHRPALSSRLQHQPGGPISRPYIRSLQLPGPSHTLSLSDPNPSKSPHHQSVLQTSLSFRSFRAQQQQTHPFISELEIRQRRIFIQDIINLLPSHPTSKIIHSFHPTTPTLPLAQSINTLVRDTRRQNFLPPHNTIRNLSQWVSASSNASKPRSSSSGLSSATPAAVIVAPRSSPTLPTSTASTSTTPPTPPDPR